VFFSGVIIGGVYFASKQREYSQCVPINCCSFVVDGKYISNITDFPGCVDLLYSSGFNCVFNNTNTYNFTENKTKVIIKHVLSSSYTLDCPSSSIFILYSMGLFIGIIMSCVFTLALYCRNEAYILNILLNSNVETGNTVNDIP
jgi:hypothetical protein